MISTYTQMHRTDKNIQSNAPYRQVLTTQLYHLESFDKWLSVRLWTTWLYVRVQLVALTKTSDFAPASRKQFLDIRTTLECTFTLKRVRDMISTYTEMHRTDKYSQLKSVIWPVWLNGWVFVYEGTKWFWVWVQLQSLKLQISRLLRARSSFDIQATIECAFTLKRVRDMIRTYT